MCTNDFNTTTLQANEIPVLLFDFTGCLSDDETPIRGNIDRLALQMGFEINDNNRDEIWSEWYGRGNKYIYEWLTEKGNNPESIPTFEDFQTKFEKSYEDIIKNGELKLRDGMADMLTAAAYRNWPRAIVTNDEPGLLAMKLRCFGFTVSDDLSDPLAFQFITGLDELKQAGLTKKPAPDAYVHTAKQFIDKNTSGKKLVFIALEDSGTGLTAASAAMQIINEFYKNSFLARFIGTIHTPYTPQDPRSDLAGVMRMEANETPLGVLRRMLNIKSADFLMKPIRD